MPNENTQLTLREVVAEDAKLLFDWANDEAVRHNSLKQDKITWQNHVDWFTAKLKDSNTRIWMLVNNHVPIGQIRIVLQDGCWTINYSIDTNFRGMGFGKQIVRLIIEKYPYYSFKAVVKKDNLASIKVFENLGFKNVKSSDSSLYLYEYSPNAK